MATPNMADQVRTLHTCLNELYALDSNWRQWGDWPSDVSGSILHPAARAEEISEAERRFGHAFPPSYKSFLQLHAAWEHFWGDFTLIGTGRSETERACAKVDEYTTDQTGELREKLGSDFTAQGITSWESEQARFMYLANHLVIGANFRGSLWVYNTASRRTDGEMTLTSWDISFGAQEPEFSTFDEFLDWALTEAEDQLAFTREAVANPKEPSDDDE